MASLILLVALLAAGLGFGIGWLTFSRGNLSPASSARVPDVPQPAEPSTPPTTSARATTPDADGSWALGPRILKLLGELPGMAVVTNAEGDVVLASPDAVRQRLVRSERWGSSELEEIAGKCIQRRETAVSDITIMRKPARRGRLELKVRSIYLDGDFAVLLMEDMTEENRLTSVRRDFIANISHELKTPVGAVSLLSEALVAASDDPKAVQHFAGRLQSEAQRLSSLIRDVIELSRLQGDDPMANPEAIHVGHVVAEAIDSVASAAEAKNIRIVLSSGTRDLAVGNEGQLIIALTNLLTNAIAYSEPNTRVAIAVRPAEDFVEIDVKDQGIGIPERELDRVFERFYRIDSARSRGTGGTGLGLAIVRNVCHNHGGSISVWSVEGEGSTFTMRLPIPGQGLLPDVDPQLISSSRISDHEQIIIPDSSDTEGPQNPDSGQHAEFDPRI